MTTQERIYVHLTLLLLLLSIHADEPDGVEDLGVLTESTGIALEPCRSRPDVAHFIVEILPNQPPTNKVTFTTTNLVLTLGDLQSVPSGPSLVGVSSVCSDGVQSPVRLFRVDIQREPPSAPTVRKVGIPSKATFRRRGIEETLTERWTTNRLPPFPQQPTNAPTRGVRAGAALKDVAVFEPLPEGTNLTYRYHSARQAYTEQVADMNRKAIERAR